MMLDTLPSDIWISFIIFFTYYDLVQLRRVSKKLFSLLSNKLVLKQWLNVYHPLYQKSIIPDFPLLKKSVNDRLLHAKKIINLLYCVFQPAHAYIGFDIKVFGGFIRDYEARTKEFSDIDVWINDKMYIQNIINQLEEKNYTVSTISIKTVDTIKYADGFAEHYKLAINNETLTNAIILDITTNCMFSQIARDYDVNSLYIKSPGFLDVDFVKHDGPKKNGLGRNVEYKLRVDYCKCNFHDSIENCRHCGIKYIVTMCRKKLFNTAKNQLFNKKEDMEIRYKKMLNMGFEFNYGRKLKWDDLNEDNIYEG
jgi:hypothetical protein